MFRNCVLWQPKGGLFRRQNIALDEHALSEYRRPCVQATGLKPIKAISMFPAPPLLALMIAVTPVILVFDGPMLYGLVMAVVAVLVAIVGIRIRPGEASLPLVRHSPDGPRGGYSGTLDAHSIAANEINWTSQPNLADGSIGARTSTHRKHQRR